MKKLLGRLLGKGVSAVRPTCTAILAAAGSSQRMGGENKLLLPLDGMPVLAHTLRAVDAAQSVDEIVIAAREEDLLTYAELCKTYGIRKPVKVVVGGATRQESVLRAALEARADAKLLAVQDGARPLVTPELFDAVVLRAAVYAAAAPAVPVKDTIKQAKGGSGKTVPAGCMVEDTPDRSTLYAVQTPQCFDRAAYLAALDELDEARARLVTDDCSLFELTGRPVELVQGDYANIKITTREDLPRAENGGKKMRIGHGYDVHRLVEGRKLILGGVEVPYEKGLLGHSDADVLAHAVMDAVLGAAALGDIGQHFPDTAEEYAGADSLVLARRVAEIVAAQGWRIENIDATILCQRPKLAPYIPVMREKLAAAFGLVDYADAVIIGSLMILVPGLLITNSMRDIIYGDTNSGVNRIVQVLLSALAIAMGTAAAWHITSSLYGQTAASTLSYPFWLQAIAIAVACTGFVILFNVHGWGRCLCALGGVVTWMAYLLCGELGLGPYGANFIAAAVAAVYAEGMARARKYPVTSYQVISAVPLLPGAGIYYTMSLGLNGSTQLALQRGFATAGIAGSIAAAILLVSSVVRLFTAQRKK